MNIEQLAGKSIFNSDCYGFTEEIIVKIKEEKKKNEFTLLNKCLAVIDNTPLEHITEIHCKLLKHIKVDKGSGPKIINSVFRSLVLSGRLLGSINEKVKLISNENDNCFVLMNKTILMNQLEYFKVLFESDMKESKKNKDGLYEIRTEISKFQLELLKTVLYTNTFPTNSLQELIDLYWILDKYLGGSYNYIMTALINCIKNYYHTPEQSVTYDNLRDVFEDFTSKYYSSLSLKRSTIESDDKKTTEEKDEFQREKENYIKTSCTSLEIGFLNTCIRKLYNGIPICNTCKKEFHNGIIMISKIHLLQDKGVVGNLLRKYIRGIHFDSPNKVKMLQICLFMKETGQIEPEFFQNVKFIFLPAEYLISNDYLEEILLLVREIFPNTNHVFLNFENPNLKYPLDQLKALKKDNEKLKVTLTSTMVPQIKGSIYELPFSDSLIYQVLINNQINSWIDLHVDYSTSYHIGKSFVFVTSQSYDIDNGGFQNVKFEEEIEVDNEKFYYIESK